jgi:hypothetical protein
MNLISSDFPREIIIKYGKPENDNSYILSYWRIDWEEYYISWKNENTILKNVSDYYWSGNRILDWLIPITTGIIFLLIIGKVKYKKSSFI